MLMLFQLTLESRFKEDLDLDSLDKVEVIMAMEDEFGEYLSRNPDVQISSEAEKNTYLFAHQ